MCYEDIKEKLFKLAHKERCPRSFIFYGKNIEKIYEVSKEFSLKLLGATFLNTRDIIEIKNDKKIISIEDIRNLNLEMMKKSEVFNNRVIIIYNGDKMTKEAQNAFLKSLEDSIENIFIILVLKDKSKIIPTILSRCLCIKFGKIDFNEYKLLVENFSKDCEEIEKLYLQTKGDIFFTISILQNGIINKMYLHSLELFKCFYERDIIKVLELSREINNFKDMENVFLDILLTVARDIYIYKQTDNENFVCSLIFKEDIKNISKNILNNTIYKFLKHSNGFRYRINLNMNLEVCYKIFILKVMEV